MRSRFFSRRKHARLYALCVAVIVATATGYALRPSSSNATKAAQTPPQATLTSLTDPSSQQFAGEVTDAGCGTTDFAVHPASTVNVTVTAATPTNDLMVNLWYGGQIVHNEDTGVGQETFTYSVDDASGGTYTVEVCKSGNPATPFMPAGGPYPYDGVFTDVDASTENPYAPPGSTTNPVTVIPTPSYGTWNAKFSSATVVDAQRTEGEPLDLIDSDGTFWESGPWGTHNQNSFIHRSTNDGQEFHLVADTGLRPDLPPGGGDTDIATDDHGNVYFTDLEALANLGTSVSHDNGMTWTKNPAAVQNTAVDRQWYAVDNGPTSSAIDNTVFLAFHQSAVGTFIYSSPGSTGANDPVGGLLWQNSSSNPSALGPLAADAICAQIRFDAVTRNLYYACNEVNHIRVTVGHVGVGQRTGIEYANFNGPRTPGGGSVLNLFPSLATDSAGNVYIAWIDKTNSNLYYAFSTDQGHSWSAPVRVNSSGSATNEFDWAQAGSTGLLTLAWYGTPRTAVGGSDGMPSSLADPGAATAYPWYGFTALVKAANTARPQILQTRFTAKPMHYGAICNSGIGCTTNPTADRQMADFFGFSVARDGGLRIVYNDTTNEFDGAGLFVTRQLGGQTLKATNINVGAAGNPVADVQGDAQYPHYSQAGVGPSLPQLDLTSLKVSNPTPTTLRFTMTVADASQLLPPPGKTTPVWLVRFQALGPLANEPQDVYHVYYAYMQKTAGALPQFSAGVASCIDTLPNDCKVLQYGGDTTATGTVVGNTITIDVGVNTGFGVPIDDSKLYSVTAFTFGRNDNVGDLYADVDATPPFDYTVGSVKK
ncbi:MAG: hypothetical protein ACJ74I_00790 [Gaiellaceae bacterium]